MARPVLPSEFVEFRAGFAKAMLRLLTDMCEASTSPRDIDHYMRQFLIGCALVMGEYEGKPMTVSDVAVVTGIARATTWREVKNLIAAGRITTKKVGRRVVLHMSTLIRDQEGVDSVWKALRRFVQEIHRLHETY